MIQKLSANRNADFHIGASNSMTGRNADFPIGASHSALRPANAETGVRRSGVHVCQIACKEIHGRFRSGWVLACVTVWLGAIGLTSFFGLVQVGRVGLQGYERTVVSLLNLAQYLVPLLGLLIGHDLIVSEREERTLSLVLASGVSRTRLVLGKFLGGCGAVMLPLALGFAIAGAVIGWWLRTRDWALSGAGPVRLGAGCVFQGIGLPISAFSRTRVQSLVLVLLAWCGAVFVFDLLALGLVISTKAPAVAQEIEVVCDATHINVAADLHSAYDAAPKTPARVTSQPWISSWSWLLANPVDVFRAVNLASHLGSHRPGWGAALSCVLWLAGSLGCSIRKLHRLDL